MAKLRDSSVRGVWCRALWPDWSRAVKTQDFKRQETREEAEGEKTECNVSFCELGKSSAAHLAWTERSGVKAEMKKRQRRAGCPRSRVAGAAETGRPSGADLWDKGPCRGRCEDQKGMSSSSWKSSAGAADAPLAEWERSGALRGAGLPPPPLLPPERNWKDSPITLSLLRF